jgi:hypothetical protein
MKMKLKILIIFFFILSCTGKGNKISQPQPEDNISFKEIICKAKGVTIDLPANWTIDTDFKHTALLAVDKNSTDTLFSPDITVLPTKIPSDSNMDLYQIVMINKNNLASSYKKINFEKEKKLVINDKQAYELPYFVYTANRELGVLSTYILSGNYSYNITCIADSNEFSKYRNLFEQVTNSIKVTNPQAN